MDPTRPVATSLDHTPVTVGTSSAQLVAANTSRKACLIQNLSDPDGDNAVINIRLDGGAASTTTGIRIVAGQMFNLREVGVVTLSAITAISDTANTPVLVVEG